VSTTSVYFVPNNDRPTWPTLDEAARWAQSISSYPAIAGGASAVNVENLQLCLDAAIERISKRTHRQVRPVDSAGAVDPLGAPVKIPVDVKLATIMLAVRVARRAMTPDGIAGASEIGGLIRTTSYDPDIEGLLFNWLELPW
jgi:hypothetical protein